MKKIRLLFVVNGFSIGGGELKLLELIRELHENHRAKFECTICSVGIEGPLKQDFEALGKRTEIFLKRSPYDITQVLRLVRLIREEKIDIVQTTLFYADVIGTYAARLAGVPHIISWEAVTQPYSFKHLMAYRLASKWFARSVAVSHAIERQVRFARRVPAWKTATIQYGVDLNRFTVRKSHALRKELGFSGGEKLIGTVARLTEQKGHVYLLEAIPAILNSHPDARFLFFGDGPLAGQLQRQAESLNVVHAVRFMGFRQDIPEVLRGLDLFVLPSLYEGLPNVVLEAMASGLPVVATAVDGTPEAVEHGKTGLLVPPRNERALSEAVCSLLDTPGLPGQMGHSGRKRVETCFSLTGQVNQFVQLYDSLLSQGG